MAFSISLIPASLNSAVRLVVSYISGHEKWDKEVDRKDGKNVTKVYGRVQEKRRKSVLKWEDTSAAM